MKKTKPTSSIKSDFARNIKYRAFLIFMVFAFFFAFFSYKAFFLQVLKNDPRLRSLQDRQLTTKITLTPRRGEILDTKMRELALSITMESLFVNPRQLKDKTRTVKLLAPILKMTEKSILQKMKGKEHFAWIKKFLEPSEAEKVKELKIPGVSLVPESRRFYPNKHLGAQVIGFVGFDSKGLEGIELKYDSNLLGEKQLYKIQTDAKGRPILAIIDKKDKSATPEMLFTNFTSKENIVLTIDKDIQYWAEKELEKAVKASQAVKGEAVVMDPSTGKILAMSNYPFFNPNTFYKTQANDFKNRTVTDMFDPGSTFKLITVAAALDSKKITPTSKFNCENGLYKISGSQKVREAMNKKFGTLTVREIIQHSSNIGTVKIAEKMTPELFYQYITKFGFNQKTGIELPGEIGGRIRSPESWNDVDKANIAFGQGISVTSLQVVSAFSAIVNGGILYKPMIVEKLLDKDKNIIWEAKTTIVRKNIISDETVTKMKDLLKSVIEPNGTAYATNIEGVTIGGKTGTAQKFDYIEGKYHEKRYISSFIGALPLENPKYVIFIKLDDPEINKYASMSAVPAFKNIALSLLDRVKKDSQTQIAKTSTPVQVAKESLKVLEPASKTVELKTIIKEGKEYIEVPSFKDLSLRQVLRTLKKTSLEYKIEGSGKVVSQLPKAGTKIHKEEALKIILE